MSDPYDRYLKDDLRETKQRLELVEIARFRAERRLARVIEAHPGCTPETCITMAALEES